MFATQRHSGSLPPFAGKRAATADSPGFPGRGGAACPGRSAPPPAPAAMAAPPPSPARRCPPLANVEPLLFLATLSLGLQGPLATQYLWDRLGTEHGYSPNATSPSGCGNGSADDDPLRQVGEREGAGGVQGAPGQCWGPLAHSL